MATYRVQAPNGKIYRFEGPAGMPEAQQFDYVLSIDPSAGIAPEVPEPKKGMGAALAKGFEQFVGGQQRGAQAFFGSPEEAAAASLADQKALGEKYAQQTGLGLVGKAYDERGVFGAIGEVGRQVPLFLAEQAPQLGTTVGGAYAGAKLGARAGLPGLVGGAIGGGLTGFLPHVSGNLAAQQEVTPGDVSLGKASLAAGAQSAVDAAALGAIAGRRVLGSVLGKDIEKVFAARGAAAAEALAKERLLSSLAKGVALGAGVEGSTEAVQDMIERAQAGKALLDDEALRSYAENFYAGALLGGPLGGAGRVYSAAGARGDAETAERKKRNDATIAAQEQAAAAEAEQQARMESPEYLQELQQRYSDYTAQKQALVEQRKEAAAEKSDAGAMLAKDLSRQIAELTREAQPLLAEYNAARPALKAQEAKFRGELNIEGSPTQLQGDSRAQGALFDKQDVGRLPAEQDADFDTLQADLADVDAQLERGRAGLVQFMRQGDRAKAEELNRGIARLESLRSDLSQRLESARPAGGLALPVNFDTGKAQRELESINAKLQEISDPSEFNAAKKLMARRDMLLAQLQQPKPPTQPETLFQAADREYATEMDAATQDMQQRPAQPAQADMFGEQMQELDAQREQGVAEKKAADDAAAVDEAFNKTFASKQRNPIEQTLMAGQMALRGEQARPEGERSGIGGEIAARLRQLNRVDEEQWQATAKDLQAQAAEAKKAIIAKAQNGDLAAKDAVRQLAALEQQTQGRAHHTADFYNTVQAVLGRDAVEPFLETMGVPRGGTAPLNEQTMREQAPLLYGLRKRIGQVDDPRLTAAMEAAGEDAAPAMPAGLVDEDGQTRLFPAPGRGPEQSASLQDQVLFRIRRAMNNERLTPDTRALLERMQDRADQPNAPEGLLRQMSDALSQVEQGRGQGPQARIRMPGAPQRTAGTAAATVTDTAAKGESLAQRTANLKRSKPETGKQLANAPTVAASRFADVQRVEEKQPDRPILTVKKGTAPVETDVDATIKAGESDTTLLDQMPLFGEEEVAPIVTAETTQGRFMELAGLTQAYSNGRKSLGTLLEAAHRAKQITEQEIARMNALLAERARLTKKLAAAKARIDNGVALTATQRTGVRDEVLRMTALYEELRAELPNLEAAATEAREAVIVDDLNAMMHGGQRQVRTAATLAAQNLIKHEYGMRSLEQAIESNNALLQADIAKTGEAIEAATRKLRRSYGAGAELKRLKDQLAEANTAIKQIQNALRTLPEPAAPLSERELRQLDKTALQMDRLRADRTALQKEIERVGTFTDAQVADATAQATALNAERDRLLQLPKARAAERAEKLGKIEAQLAALTVITNQPVRQERLARLDANIASGEAATTRGTKQRQAASQAKLPTKPTRVQEEPGVAEKREAERARGQTATDYVRRTAMPATQVRALTGQERAERSATQLLNDALVSLPEAEAARGVGLAQADLDRVVARASAVPTLKAARQRLGDLETQLDRARRATDRERKARDNQGTFASDAEAASVAAKQAALNKLNAQFNAEPRGYKRDAILADISRAEDALKLAKDRAKQRTVVAGGAQRVAGDTTIRKGFGPATRAAAEAELERALIEERMRAAGLTDADIITEGYAPEEARAAWRRQMDPAAQFDADVEARKRSQQVEPGQWLGEDRELMENMQAKRREKPMPTRYSSKGTGVNVATGGAEIKRNAREEAAAAKAAAAEAEPINDWEGEGGRNAPRAAQTDARFNERKSTALSDAEARMAQRGQLTDLLMRMMQSGSTPLARAVAGKLLPFVANTNLEVRGGLTDDGRPVAALYMPGTNTIALDPNALTEEDLLHEAVHAATLAALRADPKTLSPEQRNARAELERLYAAAQKNPAFAREYGKVNIEEFAAEVMSNPQARAAIDTQPPGWWARFKDALLRLIGVRPPPASEQATRAIEALFQPSRTLTGRAAAQAATTDAMYVSQNFMDVLDVDDYLKATDAEYRVDAPDDATAMRFAPLSRALASVLGTQPVLLADVRGDARAVGRYFPALDRAVVFTQNKDRVAATAAHEAIHALQKRAMRAAETRKNGETPAAADAEAERIWAPMERAIWDMVPAEEKQRFAAARGGASGGAASRRGARVRQLMGIERSKAEQDARTRAEFMADFGAARLTNAADLREMAARHPSELRDFAQYMLKLINRLLDWFKSAGQKQAATDAYFATEQDLQRAKEMWMDALAAINREPTRAVASVFRGPAPSAIRGDATARFAAAITANEETGPMKWMGDRNKALGFEMAFVDQRAPILKALSHGDQNKFLQAQYYLRKNDARMPQTYAVLAHGPAKLKQDSKGRYVVETGNGPSAKDIFEAIGDIPGATEQAKFDKAQAYMVAQRAANKGWHKLGFDAAPELKAMADAMMAEVNADPVLKSSLDRVRKIYNAYNKGMVEFLVDSGVMTKDAAAALLKDGDYVPFYRVGGNGVAELVLGDAKPIIVGDVRNQPYLAALKGDSTKLMPLNEAIPRNTMLLTDMGLRNLTTKSVAYALQDMRSVSPKGTNVVMSGTAPAGADIIKFRQQPDPRDSRDTGERWMRVSSEGTPFESIPSEMLVKSLEGVHTVLPVFLRVLGSFGDLLRKGVTRSPVYVARQLIRDPMAAAFTAGIDRGPWAATLKTVVEFGRQTQGTSALAAELERKGVVQSGVFTGDPDDIKQFALQLAGGNQGAFAKLAAMTDRLAMRADSATRAQVYEDVLKKTGSEMQAELAAMEMMNFTKRGSSPAVQWASRMIPFLNAQIQGLNVLAKAAFGNASQEEHLQIRQKFIKSAVGLSAMTFLYALAMDENEAYKNAGAQERASNFFVPLPDGDALRIPIPYEVGFLFKALPEALVRNMNDTHSEADTQALRTMLLNSIPGGSSYFLPQAAKPLIEVGLNRSIFTGRDIEPSYMSQLDRDQRYLDNTTELAKGVSSLLNALPLPDAMQPSPIKLDYLVRGYLGTLPIAAMQMANEVLAPPSAGERPDKRLAQQPLIGSMFQDSLGRGPVELAYAKVQAIESASATYDKLVAEGKHAAAHKYMEDSVNLLQADKFANQFKQQMTDLRQRREKIMRAPIDAARKKVMLDQLDARRVQIGQLYVDALARVVPAQ